ncbi:cell division protein FtsQ/DivIB [Candidatus Cardinium hertigii]|uniref:cell division protein FtsQ/DivIB n=1 Tax=Candidatus Cardinium hertigii TaxID=247481 RepID=UPI003D7DB873
MNQIVNRVVALFLTIILCLSLLFAQEKHTSLVCKDIAISIKAYPNQSLITVQGILDLLQATYPISLQKTRLKTIDTYAIQDQLSRHPLIKSVLVYKTWNGVLTISLETKYFIARTISLMEPNGREAYVDEKGSLIALKGLPHLRLLVITGKNIATEKRKLAYKGLLALLHYMHRDPFWQRQITSLQVKDNGKIILGTQIGGHQIEFGKAEHIEEKFQKLWLFYSQVMPYKGWNAYHRVNLEFKNQLVCQ